MKLSAEQLALNHHPDFDKVSLSPDMFKTETFNVFFFDEEIGTVAQAKDFWIATPYGTTSTIRAFCQEGAIKHLLEVREATPSKKVATALSKNQTSLFALIIFLFMLSSCDTCKHAPTYGGRGKMTQGHQQEAFKQKASSNPYYVKAKTTKSHYRNPNK